MISFLIWYIIVTAIINSTITEGLFYVSSFNSCSSSKVRHTGSFATIGEIFTEKSGNLNLGLEGMIPYRAVSGFAVTYYTKSLILGIIAGIIAGGLLSVIHAFLTVTLRANQVVSGLALTIFGTGLSGLFGKSMVGKIYQTS